MSDVRWLGTEAEEHACLMREVAAMSARILELLQRTALPASGPLAEAQDFLRAASARAERRSEDAQEPMVLGRLSSALGLAPVERDLVVLAGLCEEHEGFASVLRQLHPRGEPRASLGLAAQLLCETAPERLLLRRILETGPAFRAGLLTAGPNDLPLFERSLLLADHLWSVLSGIDVWPSALQPLESAATRAGLEDWLRRADVCRALSALRNQQRCLVMITAGTEEVALFRGLTLAAEAGLPHLAFALPGHGRAADLERLLALHVMARGGVPLLRLARTDNTPAVSVPALSAWGGPVIACAARGPLTIADNRPVLPLAVEPLTPRERTRAWCALLPEASANAAQLAARFTLEPGTIQQVARELSGEPDRSLNTLVTRIQESVRLRSARGLAQGVTLMPARARWDDLVVGPEQRLQLREIADRLSHQQKVLDDWKLLERKRGAYGIRALFSGAPGTGKTLSAEVLAGELGVDLLLVDLSRVVSKWIGETEKNLSEVFDAAEQMQAVLLFDEADALFGKRTAISDARDRYANLETAYLLTRLETFQGLTLLSSNLRTNIDGAFVRRLDFIVDFQEPSVLQREAIWRLHLPHAVPLAADVSFGELAASYALVGGGIRNAAVAAAFMAAADENRITREHLTRAIRREYQKLGKPFPSSSRALL